MTFDLYRFLEAQQGTYDGVKAELRSGHKTGHWIWFVFPQAAGLGTSPTAQYYAIATLEEAVAYAEHPILGDRLRECARLMLAVPDGSAEQILGPVDALKLRSSMSLFGAAAPEDSLFREVLQRFYDGRPDPATEGILAAWRSQS